MTCPWPRCGNVGEERGGGHDTTVTYRRGFFQRTFLVAREIQNGILRPDHLEATSDVRDDDATQSDGEKEGSNSKRTEQKDDKIVRQRGQLSAPFVSFILAERDRPVNQPIGNNGVRERPQGHFKLSEKGERNGDVFGDQYCIVAPPVEKEKRRSSGIWHGKFRELNIIVMTMQHNQARRRAVDDSTDDSG